MALVSMLLCIFSASAANVQFRIWVDDASHVSAMVNQKPYALVDGDNDFDLPDGTQIAITPVKPYVIDKIMDKTGGTVPLYTGEWYFYPTLNDQNQVYIIMTLNPEEGRAATCTINVDDASLVKVVRTANSTDVPLVNGANTVAFDPERENGLTISNADYMHPIYKVTLNGSAVEENPWVHSYYIENLKDGDVIDIIAVIPEMDVTVTFNYEEGAEGALTGFIVNDEAVEPVDNKVVLKAGQYISFNSNPDFKIDEVTVNGSVINWKGGYAYRFTVMEDSEVTVKAHKPQALKATVIVDNAENVTLFRGFSYMGNVIALTHGSNAIEVPETDTTISWEIAGDAYLVSLTVDGVEFAEPYNYLNVKEGMVIEFKTDKMVMDRTAVIWVDDASAPGFMNFYGTNGATVQLESGYNVLEFSEQLSPYFFAWTGGVTNELFLNGIRQTSLYEGANSYNLPLVDGDVVKAFIVSEPVLCTVKFDVAEGADIEVVKDIISNVENLSEELSCFKGTEIAVRSAATVSVNGEAVAADEDGVCRFTVEGDTTVEIGGSTAVEAIGAEEGVEVIYNLQGIRLRENSRDNLPAGIYIVTGKKVAVK